MKKYRYLSCAFLLCAILPCLPVPAAASDYYSDYYDISQDVVINKAQVVPGEIFQISVDVHVICIQDMPYEIQWCEFDAGVSAVHNTSGEHAIQKNFTYTVTPIPILKDETIDENFTIEFSFSATASPGSYDLIAEITGVSARYQSYAVQMGEFTPIYQTIGSITLLETPESTAGDIPEAPTVAPPPSLPVIITSQAATETTETPATTTEPTRTPSETAAVTSGSTDTPPQSDTKWWIFGGAGAVVIAVIILVCLLRRRQD